MGRESFLDGSMVIKTPDPFYLLSSIVPAARGDNGDSLGESPLSRDLPTATSGNGHARELMLLTV
jgi:hypothetical protein